MMKNIHKKEYSFADVEDIKLTVLFDTLLAELHDGEPEKPFQPSLTKPRRDYILALAHYLKRYAAPEQQSLPAMRDLIMKTDHFAYIPEDHRISISGLFSEAERDLASQPCVSFWHSFIEYPEPLKREAESSALVDLIQLSDGE